MLVELKIQKTSNSGCKVKNTIAICTSMFQANLTHQNKKLAIEIMNTIV
jgi:hypothetical protein